MGAIKRELVSKKIYTFSCFHWAQNNKLPFWMEWKNDMWRWRLHRCCNIMEALYLPLWRDTAHHAAVTSSSRFIWFFLSPPTVASPDRHPITVPLPLLQPAKLVTPLRLKLIYSPYVVSLFSGSLLFIPILPVAPFRFYIVLLFSFCPLCSWI